MFIRKDHRGRGLSKQLTLSVIQGAQEHGYTTLRLDSLERLAPAVALYSQFGWKRIPAYCANPEHDHVCMQLGLDDKVLQKRMKDWTVKR